MKREIKNVLKQQLFYFHKFATRFGIHVLPVHYYSPVPNIIELEQSMDIWARKSALPGLNIDLDQQVENLKSICLPYQSEYEGNFAYNYAKENLFGPGYGYIEAQALHAIIRCFKPKRVIEVGGGVSTWCMLTALKTNYEETNQQFVLKCIEPYPSTNLKSLAEIRLIEKQVQTIPFEEVFIELEENDLLFIDSSHTVKTGSDVNFLILEILPRLKSGVIVHFHDIYLPYDYPRSVLKTFLHWMETSLLRAFLIYNNRVRIIFCESILHYECKETLIEVFPDYNPQTDKNGLKEDKYRPFEDPIQEHFPASIFLQIQ